MLHLKLNPGEVLENKQPCPGSAAADAINVGLLEFADRLSGVLVENDFVCPRCLAKTASELDRHAKFVAAHP